MPLGWHFNIHLLLTYLSNLSSKLLIQDRLRYSSNLFVDDLSAFENKECWNIANTKSCSNVRVLINIQFTNDSFAIVVVCKLFNHGSDHLTRSAPFCPKVHEDRLTGVDNLIKIGIVKFDCFSHWRII